MKEFCKAHDLPASGASKELIKRIIDYLEGDGKENESAAVNKKSTDEEDSEEDSEEEVKEMKKEKKAKSVKSQEVAKGKSAKPQEAVAEQAEEPEGVPKKGAKVGKKTQPEVCSCKFPKALINFIPSGSRGGGGGARTSKEQFGKESTKEQS